MTITGKARVAGVIGWPVSHSRSPLIHGHWIERYGLDAAYVPLPVPPGQLETALRALPALGLCGVNVTIPHKEGVLALVDEADAVARRLGAVNLVTVGAKGQLIGSNTDGAGFTDNLDAQCPGWRSGGAPAVIFGAGGAARAVAAALQDAGVREITVMNRTRERAERLASDIGGGLAAAAWEDYTRALDGAGLLVNATSLGMAGGPALEISLDGLPQTAVVCDIVYTPLETPLLRAAADRGNPIADGLGMLLQQARPAFAGWFGVEPEITSELRDLVARDIG